MQLKQIVKRLESEKKKAWDIEGVPGGDLSMVRTGKFKVQREKVQGEGGNFGRYHELTHPAHQQVAERLEIPWRYYERCLAGQPKLLSKNVNTWLGEEPDKKFFIRGMGSKIRAFLSDRYRVIDHLNVLMCALNELQDKAEIEDAHLSETNLYIKFRSNDLKDFIRTRDDEIIGGLLLGNSETGQGAVSIKPRIFRVQCTNGMVMETIATRQVHLGMGGSSLDDDKVFLDIRSSIRTMFDQFGNIVNQLRNTTEVSVQDPTFVITNVVREYNLTEKQRDNILMSFGAEKDKTQYGIVNAVTRAAQEEKGFENRLELEKIGGKLVEMKPDRFEAFSRN